MLQCLEARQCHVAATLTVMVGRLHCFMQWFIVVCAIAWRLRWNNSSTSVTQEKILVIIVGSMLLHFDASFHVSICDSSNVKMWDGNECLPPHRSFEVWSGQQHLSDRLIFSLPCSAETDGVHPSPTLLPHSWYHFRICCDHVGNFWNDVW